MTAIVLIDKDSTLSDSRQRWHLRPEPNTGASWEEYHAAGYRDAPMQGAINLALMLHHPGLREVDIITWCPETYRVGIEGWLRACGLPWRRLRMRTVDDGNDSSTYKASYVEELRACGHEVVLAVEDWPPDADAIEALGVPVVCVDPRYSTRTSYALSQP